jgi:HNH endonuclease
MSRNKSKARISGAAISVYSNTRLGKNAQGGLYDRACMALEIDGMPCPMDVSKKSWARSKLDHIYSEVKKSHPGQFKNLVVPNVVSLKVQQIGNTLSKKPRLTFVTTDDFLKTYEWRKLRMEALKKYKPRCMCCGATPATGAVMNVDHIKPRRLFPSLAMDINNLQILCHDCNHGKGNWDQTDWRS